MDGEIQQFEEVAVTSDAPRERIRLTLIGEFRAETPDGQSLLPVSRKARALLCIIGMARPQGALRAVAGALLWTSKHREASCSRCWPRAGAPTCWQPSEAVWFSILNRFGSTCWI
jgi:hypothetical protein